MRLFYQILLLTIIFRGCTSDKHSLPEDVTAEDGVTTEDNIYLELNKWMYKEMNIYYLWRQDMPDSLDCDYDLAPRDFYYSLLSKKDRFSYFTNNDNYKPRSTNANLGFAYQTMLDKDGNTALEILYIQSNTLKEHGFKRGDLVRVSNQSDESYIINKVHTKNDVFKDDATTYKISILGTTENSSVLLDTVYTDADKRIGYLCYLGYEDKSDLDKPLKRFKSEQITDLILDLRYNPGGYVSTCKFLCNCIVTEDAYGKLFQQCSYNDILSAEYLKKTGDSRSYSYFDRPNEMPGESLGVTLTPLNLKRLYVITSCNTASASEATIICLKTYMPVTIIGEQTVGKGVGSTIISDPRFRYAIQPIIMRYYNADGVTTPDDGIPPDIYLQDGYQTKKIEIGDTNERLLNAALRCISDNYTPEENPSRAITEHSLTPIGEPSYVTDFNNKHYNESN